MIESKFGKQLTLEDVQKLIKMETIDDCKQYMKVILDFILTLSCHLPAAKHHHILKMIEICGCKLCLVRDANLCLYLMGSDIRKESVILIQ